MNLEGRLLLSKTERSYHFEKREIAARKLCVLSSDYEDEAARPETSIKINPNLQVRSLAGDRHLINTQEKGTTPRRQSLYVYRKPFR
jgi:hypothetical protein